MILTATLTGRQQQLVAAALDAAAAALESGEWPDLPGYPADGGGVGVAPILVHLAGQIGRAGSVTYHLTYGEDPVALDPTPIGAVEVAALLGVQRATVDQWGQRNLLPKRDWTVGGRPAWRTDTILTWAKETGRPAPGRHDLA